MSLRVFWSRGFGMVLLGEPQSAAQDRVLASLKVVTDPRWDGNNVYVGSDI